MVNVVAWRQSVGGRSVGYIGSVGFRRIPRRPSGALTLSRVHNTVPTPNHVTRDSSRCIDQGRRQRCSAWESGSLLRPGDLTREETRGRPFRFWLNPTYHLSLGFFSASLSLASGVVVPRGCYQRAGTSIRRNSTKLEITLAQPINRPYRETIFPTWQSLKKYSDGVPARVAGKVEKRQWMFLAKLCAKGNPYDSAWFVAMKERWSRATIVVIVLCRWLEIIIQWSVGKVQI